MIGDKFLWVIDNLKKDKETLRLEKAALKSENEALKNSVNELVVEVAFWKSQGV